MLPGQILSLCVTRLPRMLNEGVRLDDIRFIPLLPFYDFVTDIAPV